MHIMPSWIAPLQSKPCINTIRSMTASLAPLPAHDLLCCQVIGLRTSHSNVLAFKRFISMGALNLDMAMEATFGRMQGKVGAQQA